MNIRDIANCSTSIINQNIPVTVHKFVTNDLNEDGTVNIEYTDIETTAQIQSVPSERLQHINGYSAGSVYKEFYFNEQMSGISAPNSNDKITVGAETYKVIELSEDWYLNNGWSKVLGIRI